MLRVWLGHCLRQDNNNNKYKFTRTRTSLRPTQQLLLNKIHNNTLRNDAIPSARIVSNMFRLIRRPFHCTFCDINICIQIIKDIIMSIELLIHSESVTKKKKTFACKKRYYTTKKKKNVLLTQYFSICPLFLRLNLMSRPDPS